MPVANDNSKQRHSAKETNAGMITERDLKILWVARTLSNIDFEYGEDLLKLINSDIEAEQKLRIEKRLLLKYRERREPYQKLLESLRASDAKVGTGFA